jgi:hypothetical protein
MADLQFDLFCNAIYTVPVGVISRLSVTVPFTFAGLTADSTPPLVTVSAIAWEMDSAGNVLERDIALESMYTNLSMPQSGQGHAQTTLALPTFASNVAAVAINCTIQSYMNIVQGSPSIYLQPQYSVALQNPASGNVPMVLPMVVNNSAYTLPIPPPSNVTVLSSTPYPPNTQSSATTSTATGTESSSNNKRDITVSVPITVTAPQPSSPPTYLGVVFTVTLSIVSVN